MALYLTNQQKKVLLMVAFAVLGTLAILFQSLKATSDKRESDELITRNIQAQQDLLFRQRGDPAPEHAPFIEFFQGDTKARRHIDNQVLRAEC